MYSETETIAKRINTDFGLAIFTDLLGIVPKNGKSVRLFDTTPTTQEVFYLRNKYGFPQIKNFSSGEKYTPITAYQKAYNLSKRDAFKELCNKYINTVANTPNRTYTPAIATQVAQVIPANPLEVAIKDFEDSISNRHKSNFISFLRKTFTTDIVKQVLKMYDVGNTIIDNPKDLFWNKFDTAFWYRDANNKLLNAKYFAYNKENGKRSKTVTPNWLHAQKHKETPKIGFFGEHLNTNNNQTIWIVESEKSAIIVAIRFLLDNVTNKVVWACGGSGRLFSAFENCSISKQELQKRKIVLIPDTDTTQKSFNTWNEYVERLTSEGYNVSVSEYLENNCTDIQKEQKFDIADLIISEYLEKEINETVEPAENEVTQLSYQSYSNLFKCFNHSFNFGAKVDVYVFEQNPTIDVELTTFFNSFDFGKNVEFNVFEVPKNDTSKALDKVQISILSELEKTVKLVHQTEFKTTLQANGEIVQILCK